MEVLTVASVSRLLSVTCRPISVGCDNWLAAPASYLAGR